MATVNYIAIFSHDCKHYVIRSSHPEVLLEKGVSKIYSKFTGEHPCLPVISIKLQSNLIEITLWHGCSPVNLLHIFRTAFTKNTSERLLLCYGIFFRLLGLSGDIVFNPRPKPDPSQSFSICHWDLHSVSAHNYSKISLLTAYISINDFDINMFFWNCDFDICLSSTDINDGNLKIMYHTSRWSSFWC